MKSIYSLLCMFAVALTACNSEDKAAKTENAASSTTNVTATTTTTTVTTTPPATTGEKPPFPIADSSKGMTLDGGVKLFILKQGEGLTPKMEDKVLAHYNGRLLNGNVFDSSFERGTPAEFPLKGVIQGWQVAFQHLKPGAHAVIIIPPAMGYGAQSQAKIPANSTLVFDVDFITTM